MSDDLDAILANAIVWRLREQRQAAILSARERLLPPNFGGFTPTRPGKNEIADEHWVFRFPNNYGASIVRGSATYARSPKTWELAVLHWAGDSELADIVYDTPLTNDVLVLSEEDLPMVLHIIEVL